MFLLDIWCTIWSASSHLEVLNEHLSSKHLSVCVYLYPYGVHNKVIRVHSKDKPLFDDQYRHPFDLKQEAHLRLTRDRSRD